MEKIYTKEEVAEILSIKELTVSRWIRSGKLPHIRLNGSNSIRVTETQLQEYLNRRKETANRDSSTYKRRKQPSDKLSLDLVLT